MAPEYTHGWPCHKGFARPRFKNTVAMGAQPSTRARATHVRATMLLSRRACDRLGIARARARLGAGRAGARGLRPARPPRARSAAAVALQMARLGHCAPRRPAGRDAG